MKVLDYYDEKMVDNAYPIDKRKGEENANRR